MRVAPAWQFDLRPAGNDDPEALLIVLGGCWRMDQALPSAEILQTRLTAPVRRLGFDAGGLPPGVQRLLAMASAVPEQRLAGRPVGPQGLFAQVGEATLEFFRGAPQMLGFLGEMVLSLLRLLSGRARFRPRDLWLEIEEVGPRALPIVSVISFLVGLILVYLGADQLKPVGAQIFIADGGQRQCCPQEDRPRRRCPAPADGDPGTAAGCHLARQETEVHTLRSNSKEMP